MIDTKREQKILKRILVKRPYRPREIKSLLKATRVLPDGDEGFIEYGYLPVVSSASDEEIIDYIESYIVRSVPAVDWSPTGCTFTRYYSWHRNPNGMVSVVNKVGLDI